MRRESSEPGRRGGSRGRWAREVELLTERHARGEIDDSAWFAGMTAVFEAAYLAGENPREQSGFGGDETRWERARRPIVEAIDRDGAFLDVGCANGHLLECLVRWSPHRLDPYGLDLAPRLVALARERLPQWAARLHVANALDWAPPRRFDFVRTELVYVPPARRRELVGRLLGDVVAPGGRLIVCGYGSPRSGVRAEPVGAALRSYGLEPELALCSPAPEGGGALLELAAVRRT